jgi:hypothetical protein
MHDFKILTFLSLRFFEGILRVSPLSDACAAAIRIAPV